MSKLPPEPFHHGRATVLDIAAAAKVSTATVDRVLNRRPGVRDATAQKVLRAAAELDYLPENELYAALAPSPMRISFLLPKGTNRFINMLGDTVHYSQESWAPYNVKARVEYIEGFNPKLLAASLMRQAERADGVAFMAIEHPLIRDAVNFLTEKGVHVITLISDISNSGRAAYIGLENRSAGRTAAYLIARFIGPHPAKVAMIAGSLSYRAHEEREMGFLYLFKELFPGIEVAGLREGQDNAEENYRLTRQLLKQSPDLAGIYNIGGASDGVARALKETGLEHKIVFIGHGLTPDTRALLIDGTMDAVITQNPQSATMSCVRIFANLRDHRGVMSGVDPVQSQIIFRENLP
ncbi:LacI family DNA-binding transcriptional regulator [Paralcaligenes sp. KSB-10]|jgi:LacI family transcriptional regulator|uniref:LacI family DNA-binding transcriptional regulator n=1 Tax=Paralcaligenes sp. KSB-10 TaxID=2901142 RepID=UPI001E2D9276|nr:LacI family DNA-binding transcriptional regulator [Paralcaligenes sp. KSB-10]UHL64586.1 LacI family DNA-binding transcriptional regulator [Paralcaligenes sp. KSB-10]